MDCFFESLWRRYFHKQLSGARDIDATNETIASGHRKQCEYSLQTSKWHAAELLCDCGHSRIHPYEGSERLDLNFLLQRCTAACVWMFSYAFGFTMAVLEHPYVPYTACLRR